MSHNQLCLLSFQWALIKDISKLWEQKAGAENPVSGGDGGALTKTHLMNAAQGGRNPSAAGAADSASTAIPPQTKKVDLLILRSKK